jgi:hypothetical protein
MKNIRYFAVFTFYIAHFSLSAEALTKYVAKEQWQQAREFIDQKQKKCHENSVQDKLTLKNCLLETTFTTAWLNSKQANSISENENKKAERYRLLTLARDDYFTILKSRPNHNATINNLIITLEKLEDQRSLMKLFPSLKQPSQIAESAEIIAHLSLENNTPNTAVIYLLKAFQINQSDGTLSRLLYAFSLKPTQKQARALLTQAKRSRDNSLNHASKLFAVIAKHESKVDELTWEQAVLGWVEIEGKLRHLTANLVDKTFSKESSKVFQALHERLSAPYLGADAINTKLNRRIMQTGNNKGGWWTKNEHRALALGIAGWSMGHSYLLKGQANYAQSIWLGALYYAPNPTAYRGELKDKRAITLELLTDLARLQQVYKNQVDPNGHNFKAIENLLFKSKAKAYEVNDLKAISRHHTLLGKLYADLGIFERGYKGAEFQLTNAIRSTKRLAKQNKTTPPAQPLLAKLLAEGYSCKLAGQKGNCSKKAIKASNWYKKATLGFLSLDALPQAQKTLNSAKKFTISASPQIKEMEIILKARQNKVVTQTNALPLWLKQTSSSLPKSFVNQQKFKILAEKGLKGDKKSATHALSISKKINVNQSIIDKNRLLKLQKINKKGDK